MKLSKFFKYGFLAIGLLGNAIAMDDKYEGKGNGLGDSFNALPNEQIFIINDWLTIKENVVLARTSKSWEGLVSAYIHYRIPSKDFTQEININIHPDLCGEIMNFGCMPQSLCIFLPFEENTMTEKATSWAHYPSLLATY